MAEFDPRYASDGVQKELTHRYKQRVPDSDPKQYEWVEWTCNYYRFRLHGWQQAEPQPPNPEAWPYKGFHCTDCRGAIKIIQDRRIKPGRFPGCYCMLVKNPKH